MRDLLNEGYSCWARTVGPRMDTADGEAYETALELDIETDGFQLVAVRREQRYLRRQLIGTRVEAPCAICGRTLPKTLLVAAHIAPRKILSEAERLDFSSAAMLACVLGCDSLFEHGYITVDASGHLVPQRLPETIAAAAAVDDLIG